MRVTQISFNPLLYQTYLRFPYGKMGVVCLGLLWVRDGMQL